jgi:hypothetical protein
MRLNTPPIYCGRTLYYYDFIFIIALFTRRVPMSFRKPPEWAHSVMTNCWRTRTIQQRCSALAGTKTTTSSHHRDPFVATSVCTCVCQISWLMTRRQFFFYTTRTVDKIIYTYTIIILCILLKYRHTVIIVITIYDCQHYYTYILTATHYMVHSNRHKSIVGRQFLYGCPAPSCTACASPYLLAFVPDLMDKSDEVATPHWVTYDVITVEPHCQTRQLASLPWSQ